MVLSELDSRRSLRSETRKPEEDKGKATTNKAPPPPRKVTFAWIMTMKFVYKLYICMPEIEKFHMKVPARLMPFRPLFPCVL